MATQVQRRRGTASEHNSFTGAAGEVTVNTTNDSLHVHDGATSGGFEAMRADADNAQNDVITNDMLSLNANDSEIKKALNADQNSNPIAAVRVWVQHDENGNIRNSLNVSSVSKDSEGRFQLNYATAFSTVRCTVGSSGRNKGTGSLSFEDQAENTSTSCAYATTNTGFNYDDYDNINVIVVSD